MHLPPLLFPVVVSIFPAKHAPHCIAPIPDALPTAHSTHVVFAASPLYVPSLHGVQCVLLMPTATGSPRLPAGQALHCVAVVAPKAELYRPKAHALHDESSDWFSSSP